MAHKISIIIDDVTYDRVIPKNIELMCDECDLRYLCENKTSFTHTCISLAAIDGREIFKKR